MIQKILMWLIDFLRDVQGRRARNKKDTQYFCSHLVVILEKYVDGCAAVVGDDGLCYGQLIENGHHVAQVDLPTLELDSNNEAIKFLPTKLIHAIVQFPREIEIANAMINGASEHATPPDYGEAFEGRQYQYAKLGLKAQSLSSELRKFASMQSRDCGEWSVLEYLNDHLSRIEEIRNRRAEQNAKLWESLNSTENDA